MMIKAAAILGACLAVAGAAPAQSMFAGNAAHTGVAASAAPRTAPRVKWTFATGARIVGSAVWHEGAVIFGSDDGNVYAVDAASGRQRWMFRTDGPVPATPAVHRGTVYVPSYDGRLLALDAASGELRWAYATGGERRFEAKGLNGMQPRQQTMADPFDVFLSSPVVAEGLVIFGSGDGHVHAVDAQSGRPRWAFKTGDVVHASPAVADGIAVVGSWDGRLYAIDIASGAQRWVFQAGVDPLMANQQGFQSSPSIADGVVYTGCRDAHVYAIDLATGRERWRYSTDASWVNSTPAVHAGRVYAATSDSARYLVLDAASGKPVHERPTQAYVFSSPVVAGEVVLMGVLNGVLQARDRVSGALLWEFRTEASRANLGWVLTADQRFNARLTFPNSWHDTVVAAAARQWSVGSFFATPLLVSGVIYIGSADGNLYALSAEPGA